MRELVFCIVFFAPILFAKPAEPRVVVMDTVELVEMKLDELNQGINELNNRDIKKLNELLKNESL